MTCQHSAFYVRDTVHGMVPWQPCPLCVEVERDALAARLAEAVRLLNRCIDGADFRKEVMLAGDIYEFLGNCAADSA